MSPLVTVLIGAALLGSVAGVVGSFAVLRRRALAGDLLAHAALPGICIAYLIVGERQFAALLIGALVSGVIGIGLVTLITRWTRTKEDAAIGIVLSTFFGGGVALSSVIQRMPSGSKAGLESYIFGQAAAMGRQDLLLIGGVSLVALIIVLALYKEFKLLSFDAEFAQAQGWPTLKLDLAMMALVALVTVVGLPAVGVVLMAAMLILPGATARLWTNRLGRLLVIAGVLGAATGAIGTLLSDDRMRAMLPWDPLKFGNNKGLPTGPLVVLVGSILFLISLLVAPRTGLIARFLASTGLRLRIAEEHLLRTLFELGEGVGHRMAEAPVSEVARLHHWSAMQTWLTLTAAGWRNYIDRSRFGIRLTKLGQERAAELTRRHRLWEHYLIADVRIAPDHVDRDADDIEHLLPPEILDRLEAELIRTGTLETESATLPASPHRLPELPAKEAPSRA